jgi:chromosome segregation ATPase
MKNNSKTVSARLSMRESEKLQKTGYTVKDAINFFTNEYFKNNKNFELKIRFNNLIKNLEDYEKQKRNLEFNINEIKNEIKDIKEKLGGDDDTIKEVSYYDKSIEKAIKTVQSRYERKKGFISNVLELDEDIFVISAKNADISLDEFKKLCLEKVH